MKTKPELLREIELLKRQLASGKEKYIPVPDLIKYRMKTLYWVLEICEECGKNIKNGTKSGSTELCDECYQKIEVAP